VTRLDHVGHPIQCTISIGQNHKVLNIKPSGKHFSKNFRPESLKWLPAKSEPNFNQELSSSHCDQRVCVFFDRKTEKYFLSQTTLNWQTEIHPSNRSYHDGRTHQSHKNDFADIAVSLDAFIQTEKVELDLENSYKDNPLLAHARSEITKQTSSKPRFKESSEKLSSPEIYKRIKTEWDTFVNCPWSSEINGTLALLKYHSENGEKARFWSRDFEGQYGFRLRTRDHSWIEGDIYILAAAETDSKKDSVQMMHYRNDGCHSVGKMFLNVYIKKDERH
jgi:hypothetical protein